MPRRRRRRNYDYYYYDPPCYSTPYSYSVAKITQAEIERRLAMDKHKKLSTLLEGVCQFTNDHIQFEELQQELNEANNYSETMEADCDTNYLLGFDPEHFKKESFDIKSIYSETSKNTFEQQLSIASTCIDQLKYNVCIIYKDHEESLKNYQICPHKTISRTIYPHIISSLVRGFKVNIELYSLNECKENDLKSLVELLVSQEKVPESLDVSDIFFSVSGKIPAEYMVDNFILTRKTLNELTKFVERFTIITKYYNFYFKIKDKEVLSISKSVVNLTHFFSPMLEKLSQLKDILSTLDDEKLVLFSSIVQLIAHECLSVIRLVAQCIKENRDCSNLIKFLRVVMKCFAIDKSRFVNFINTFVSLMNDEDCLSNMFEIDTKKFDNDWKITVNYQINISLKHALDNLENSIRSFFSSRSTFGLDEVQLSKEFIEFFNWELGAVAMNLRMHEYHRNVLETFLYKNVNCKYNVTFVVESDISTLDVVLMKNESVLSPTYPILSPPRNIEMTEVSHNEITIAWDMDDDSNVHSYRVEYRNVNNKSGKWFSLMTDNKEKSITVDSLADGKYVFKVQAKFGDIYGVPSEISGEMCTLKNEQNAIVDNTHCLICKKETIGIAFVPCGHMCGVRCGETFDSECPVCGESIQLKLKLHNSSLSSSHST